MPNMNLKGTVYRQLFMGQPYLVFVSNPGLSPRLVGEVQEKNGEYVPAVNATPQQWLGCDHLDGAVLVAEYLAKVKR